MSAKFSREAFPWEAAVTRQVWTAAGLSKGQRRYFVRRGATKPAGGTPKLPPAVARLSRNALAPLRRSRAAIAKLPVLGAQPLQARIAFCTCPSAEIAERIARTLVEERLAACVNAI